MPTMKVTRDEEKTVGAKLKGDWREAFVELEETGISTTGLIQQGIIRLLKELRSSGHVKAEKLPLKPQPELALPGRV